MRIMFIGLAGLGILCLQGCGSEDEAGSSPKGLAQDIRHIQYKLKVATINTRLEYPNQGSEDFHRVIRYGLDSKDQISRIVQEDGKFVPVVNDKVLGIRISPVGEIRDEGFGHDGDVGCKLSRNSKVWGVATNEHLDLYWDLTMEMRGESCTDESKATFVAFQDKELAKLNLNSARDTLSAVDSSRGDANRIHLHLRIEGQAI